MKFRQLLLFILFGTLPFQSQILRPFTGLSRRIVPSDLVIPDFFYKRVFFYQSDILLLLFAGITLYTARKNLSEFFFQGPSKYLVSLLFFCFLSIACCASPHYAIHYYRLLELGFFVLFFLAFKFFLTRLPDVAGFFRKLFLVILASSLFQAGVAFTQFVTKASIGLKFLGEANVHLFAFLRQGDEIIALRPSGTFTHPNVLGGFLFFALLTTFYLLIRETKKFKQLLFSGALLIQVAALMLTVSRSALFGYLLSMSLLVVLLLRMRAIPVKKICFFCSPILISLVASLILFYPQIKAKGGLINYNTLAYTCDQERIIYQKVAWEMHKDYPLLGIGFDHFQLVSPNYQPKDYAPILYSKVHNVFLLILAETGVFGLSSFMFFLFSLIGISPQEKVLLKWLGKAQKTIRVPSETGLLSSLMLAIFAGFLFIGVCDFYPWDLQHGRILFFGTCAILGFHRRTIPVSLETLS